MKTAVLRVMLAIVTTFLLLVPICVYSQTTTVTYLGEPSGTCATLLGMSGSISRYVVYCQREIPGQPSCKWNELDINGFSAVNGSIYAVLTTPSSSGLQGMEVHVLWNQNPSTDGRLNYMVNKFDECYLDDELPNSVVSYSATVYLNIAAPTFNYSIYRFPNGSFSLNLGRSYWYSISTGAALTTCSNSSTGQPLQINSINASALYTITFCGAASPPNQPASTCRPPTSGLTPATSTTNAYVAVTSYAVPSITKSGWPNLGGATLSINYSYPSTLSPIYTWYRNEVEIQNSNTSSYFTTIPGEYKVKVSILGGDHSPRQEALSNIFVVHPAINTTPSDSSLTGKNIIVLNDLGYPTSIVPPNQLVSASDISQTIMVADGLGRVIQSIDVLASPSYRDGIQFQEINQSLNKRQYLPFTSLSTGVGGKYCNSPTTEQASFYNGSTNAISANSKPYSEIRLDSTPFNRINVTSAPDAAWSLTSGRTSSTRTIRYTGSNTFPRYTWNYATSKPVFTNSFYTSAEVVVKRSLDPQGTVTDSYYDLAGRRIAISQPSDVAGVLSYTLEIRDDFNRVRVVFPPEAINQVNLNGGFFNISQTNLNSILSDRCYLFQYDESGQLTSKSTPGKGIETFIYDNAGNVIATQSPRLAVFSQEGVTRYKVSKTDIQGRVIASGIATSSSAPTQLQTQIYASNTMFEKRATSSANSQLPGYTDVVWPYASDFVADAVTYYDDYDFDRNGAPDDRQIIFSGEADTSRLYMPGAITGAKWRQLDEANPSAPWSTDFTWYDLKGRVIQQVDGGFGTPVTSFKLDWSGRVTETFQRHRVNLANYVGVIVTDMASETLRESYIYDHRGRIKRIESGSVVLAAFEYNELGKLIEKNIYSADRVNFLQSVDFRYHNLGYLKSVNSIQGSEQGISGTSADFFALELGYEAADPVAMPAGHTPAAQRYDGRIAWARWKDSFHSDTVITHHYEYGLSNRLAKARSYCAKLNAGVLPTTWTNLNTYEHFTYNLEGNITSLNRVVNATSVDNLEYNYAGARLTNVRDWVSNTIGLSNGADFRENPNYANQATVEYTYDENGNVLHDVNRDFSANYNSANLVSWLRGPGGTNSNETTYRYDGFGRLRSMTNKIPTTGSVPSPRTTLYYAQGITFQLDTSASGSPGNYTMVPSALKVARTEWTESYVASGVHHFTISDQLSTPRVIFNQSGQIVARHHYLAYGVRHPRWSSTGLGGSSVPEVTFGGGVSSADALAIQWQVNGARLYDPVLGCFLGVDVLAAVRPWEATYSYASSDPINHLDPTGKAWESSNSRFYRVLREHQAALKGAWRVREGGGRSSGGRWVTRYIQETHWTTTNESFIDENGNQGIEIIASREIVLREVEYYELGGAIDPCSHGCITQWKPSLVEQAWAGIRQYGESPLNGSLLYTDAAAKLTAGIFYNTANSLSVGLMQLVPGFDDHLINNLDGSNTTASQRLDGAVMTLTSFLPAFTKLAPSGTSLTLQLEQKLVTPNGVRIIGFTDHSLTQASGAGDKLRTNFKEIIDALRNPLKINPVKIDATGRPSQLFVGNGATVGVNPNTGGIVTVYPTSTYRLKQLIKLP